MRARNKGLRVGLAVATGALVLTAIGFGAAASSGGPRQKVEAAKASRFVNTPGSFGSLPKKHGKPRHGGTISVAQLSAVAATWIFPITPGADLSVYTADFEDFMWRPLWWSPNGDSVPSIDKADSLAALPKFTDHNRVVTIHLKKWFWSNGKQVTSLDVKFDFWLFKAAITLSPANEGNYTPGLYPDNVVSIRTPNKTTLVVTFKKTYNQDFLMFTQLGLLEPLPWQAWAKTSMSGKIMPANAHGWQNLKNAEAIYKFLSGQSSPHTFATNPLWKTIDGPYHVTYFDPADGTYYLTRNAKYSGHKSYASKIDFDSYTSTSSEFNALRTNKVDIGFVDQSDIPAIGAIKSNYSVWGEPNFGWNYVVYNFKDKTGDFDHIIGQQYIRDVLAHAQNESAVIKSRGIFDGAADPAYGPVPSVPPSPLAPKSATHNPYPFNLKTAKKLLTSHGWKVLPKAVTVCLKGESGKGHCGAGIPAGTKLSWTLYYGTTPALIGGEDAAWVSNLAHLGIKISLVGKTFNYMIQNFNDVSAPGNDNKWAMDDFGGFTGIEYPTTNEVFNTKGSFNLGGFSVHAIDVAINNSIYSLSNDAVKKEADLVGRTMPGLFQPNPDLIFAFSKKISSLPQYLTNQSQYTLNPEYWYLIKK